jgi:hypothetical protein
MRSPAGAPRCGVLTGGGSARRTPGRAYVPPVAPKGAMGDRYSDAPRARLLVAEGRGPGLPECVRCVLSRPQAPHPAPPDPDASGGRPLASGTATTLVRQMTTGISFTGTDRREAGANAHSLSSGWPEARPGGRSGRPHGGPAGPAAVRKLSHKISKTRPGRAVKIFVGPRPTKSLCSRLAASLGSPASTNPLGVIRHWSPAFFTRRPSSLRQEATVDAPASSANKQSCPKFIPAEMEP